ncbi:MAG: hypothetical protein F6K23_28300 [Okeania sp. SIO2C9]|uniref:hypothetical protein n=1 Tax=Okeania sp. SIO2C9 TaxID=2607791 RepID=UPI0013BF1A0A|nr:hypothetical protein [Okeania sp. SIO2C9]NEQ76594.1 hypothetical protein [Okeania sp. SIO2C9]
MSYIEDLAKILEFVKSLGGGGLFGSGLLGIIYLFLGPSIFPPTIPVEMILIIGALFGGGCHKLLNSLAITIAKNREESPKQKELLEILWVLKICKDNGMLPPELVQKLVLLQIWKAYGDIPASEMLEMQRKFLTDSIQSDSEQRQIRGSSDDESNS